MAKGRGLYLLFNCDLDLPTCFGQDCGRQFVDNPTQKIISQQTLDLVDRLLLEKFPRSGIVRAARVSKKWLQDYVNIKFHQAPHAG